MSVRILLGDVRDKLRELPDESVHCVVTSPPYFGLRDYGTASWEGGDPACDHKQGTARQDGGRVNVNGFNGSAKPDSDKGPMNFRDICGKCGATRTDKQIGLEPTPAEFVAVMVEVFRDVRRVLRKDGTLWLNLGDSYAAHPGQGKTTDKVGDKQETNAGSNTAPSRHVEGLKAKDLIGVPWRVAFALQADGWYLRQDIIWAKPNPMPESVTDRCTKAHEYLFLLSKSARYHYDAEAIKQEPSPSSDFGNARPETPMPSGTADGVNDHRYTKRLGNGSVGSAEGVNRRSVWTVATQPFKEAHFATFPPDLIEPCIKAGCPKDCCAKCGAPVVREVERRELAGADSWEKRKAAGVSNRGSPNDGHNSIIAKGVGFSHNLGSASITTGWSPSCSCYEGAPDCFVPKYSRGVVLDPFGGAGTTGLVADRLQRDAILIELNPEYAEIARARLTGDAPLFAEVA